MNNRISLFSFFIIAASLLTLSFSLYATANKPEELITTEDITLIRKKHAPLLLKTITNKNPFATKILRKKTLKENVKKQLYVDWIIHAEIINNWYTKNLATEKPEVKISIQNIDWITLQEVSHFLHSFNPFEKKENENNFLANKPTDKVIEILNALYKIKNDLHLPILRPIITEHFLDLLALNNNANDETTNKANAAKIIADFTEKVKEAIQKTDPVAHQHLLSQLDSMHETLIQCNLQQLPWTQTLSTKKVAITALAAGGTVVASGALLRFVSYLFSGSKAADNPLITPPPTLTPAEIEAEGLKNEAKEKELLRVAEETRLREETERREQEEKDKAERKKEEERLEEERRKEAEIAQENEKKEKERIKKEEEINLMKEEIQNRLKALEEFLKGPHTTEELEEKKIEITKEKEGLPPDVENREIIIDFYDEQLDLVQTKINELEAAAAALENAGRIERENRERIAAEKREKETREREKEAREREEKKEREYQEERAKTEEDREEVNAKLEEYKISEDSQTSELAKSLIVILEELAKIKTAEAQQKINEINQKIKNGEKILDIVRYVENDSLLASILTPETIRTYVTLPLASFGIRYGSYGVGVWNAAKNALNTVESIWSGDYFSGLFIPHDEYD
jgi:hypothetical protein